MKSTEFKERLDRLGLLRREAAELLGLSLNGLFYQLRGERRVSRQTEILLQRLEAERKPTPNAETVAAMEAARRGEGKTFTSLDELFADLNSDEEC